MRSHHVLLILLVLGILPSLSGRALAGDPWKPDSYEDIHLSAAWRYKELDTLLHNQGRSEPWATDTEKQIEEYVAAHTAAATQVHAVSCAETFCRVSLEFDNEDARADFNTEMMLHLPEFMRHGRGLWRRGDTYLEMVIAREGYTQPDVGQPISRPEVSILESFPQ